MDEIVKDLCDLVLVRWVQPSSVLKCKLVGCSRAICGS